jgi:acetyl esterase/lipase
MPGPAGELAYRLYAPADHASRYLPGFVFFHGGGMVAGSIESHDRICAALAQTTGCRVVSVDYRLAPEHKFPAAVEDAIAATRWVSEQAAALGIDAAKLLVGGDSAGATLAAVVCQQNLRHAGPAIAAQCLICPVLDFEEPSPSRQAFSENHLLDGITLQADLADYLHEGADLADPRISPLRAVKFAGLPAAIIHTAEFDPMRDEGNAYASKLVAAGVAVEHICHDGMVHNFHALGAMLPQGRLVFHQIGEQVRRALGI